MFCKLIQFSVIFLSINLFGQSENVLTKEPAKPDKINPDPSQSTELKAMHDLTIYPNIENMTKNVIFMDPRANETHYKVEFYAVKSVEIDDCNKHYLLGDFEVKTLEGYGYPYYLFKSNGQVISTKMACENSAEKIKDVASGKTEIVRYMSLLPIVIYTPREIDIKYKIWHLDPKELDARGF